MIKLQLNTQTIPEKETHSFNRTSQKRLHQKTLKDGIVQTAMKIIDVKECVTGCLPGGTRTQSISMVGFRI